MLFRNEKIYILWFGRLPIVLLLHPDTVEPLLNSNSSLEKGDSYKFFNPWLGLGLLTSTGDKWRKDRKLLTPTFHFRILEDFVSVMNEQAAIMVQKLRSASESNEWLDPFHFASRCTLDIISETAMGCKIGAQEKTTEYGDAIKRATYLYMSRVAKPWLRPDWIYYKTKEGREFNKSIQIIREFTKNVISSKIQNINLRTATNDEGQNIESKRRKRLAFLDLLLDNNLNSDELMDQVNTFMFAGHDTTSSALSWILYILGLYPEIQEKVTEEVERVFDEAAEKQLDQEVLKHLKYTDCVIKETQRIYPSVPGISRKLAEDTLFGDYMIPKDTEVVVPFYSIHRNPDVFPNPEVFDPDRFLLHNVSGRDPFAFIPFSAGPRNCIGQRFATIEVRVLLCYILRHFRIKSLDQRDQLFLVSEVVLRPMVPLRIKFIPK